MQQVKRRRTLGQALFVLVLSLAVWAMLSKLLVDPAQAKRGGSEPPVDSSFVEHEGVVSANGVATFAANCPASHPHPVGDEFAGLQGSVPDQIVLAASYPQRSRGWVVVVANLLNQPQGYFAGIVCVHANATFAYPRTTTVAQPNGKGTFGVNCPRKAPRVITEYFGPQSATDLGKTLLTDNGARGVKPQGASGVVKNLSAVAIGLFGGAVCTSLRTGATYTQATLAPGQDGGWRFRCPRSTPTAVSSLLVTKRAADSGTLAAFDSEHLRGRYTWKIDLKSLTDHPVGYSAGALCIG